MSKPLELIETTFTITEYRPNYAITNPNMEEENEEDTIIAYLDIDEDDSKEWLRVLNSREDIKKALEKVMIAFNPKYMSLDQDQKEALLRVSEAYEKLTGKQSFKKW